MEKLLPRSARAREQLARLARLARPARATPSNVGSQGQQPFARVAPLLRAALLLGAGGGFALASLLSLALALGLPLGPWWSAVVQAHGHLQLYGWAGLFVLGVALHFLPRLRGAPLVWPRAIPWLLGALVTALVLRGLSQPLLSLANGGSAVAWLWRATLLASGVLEALALGGVIAVLGGAALRRDGPPLRTRQALWSVWPFLLCAVGSLGLATAVNLADVVQVSLAPSNRGIISAAGDGANVVLGLFGFLIPMALAMSARALPMYAGLDAFPQRALWPTALVYCAGLALALIGQIGGGDPTPGTAFGRLSGIGLAIMGGVLVVFIVLCAQLMSSRGRLPARVRALAPTPEQSARNYTRRVATERATYGPYVALIGSAYSWALLAGLLLLLDGGALALGANPPVSLDAPRHSLALGFIALLMAGVSSRMIPGFSGGRLASPRWVVALLWLGNGAAVLRVGSLLALPALAGLGATGLALDSVCFGLSGPLGLAFAICLTINLWPALSPGRRA